MGTATLDIPYVLVFYSRQLVAIAQDGFFDAIDPSLAHATFDRKTAFWHLAFGLMATTLGGLVRRGWLRLVR